MKTILALAAALTILTAIPASAMSCCGGGKGKAGMCARGGMAKSGMAKSGMAKSGMAKSGMAKSGMAKSGMAKSGMAKSGMAKSGMAKSGMAMNQAGRKAACCCQGMGAGMSKRG